MEVETEIEYKTSKILIRVDRMKKIIGIILLAIILVSLVFSFASWGNKEESSAQNEVKTVKIGYLPITHALPLYPDFDS